MTVPATEDRIVNVDMIARIRRTLAGLWQGERPTAGAEPKAEAAKLPPIAEIVRRAGRETGKEQS